MIEFRYIALSNAIKKVVYVKNFVIELGMVPSIENLIKLYYDNNKVIV